MTALITSRRRISHFIHLPFLIDLSLKACKYWAFFLSLFWDIIYIHFRWCIVFNSIPFAIDMFTVYLLSNEFVVRMNRQQRQHQKQHDSKKFSTRIMHDGGFGKNKISAYDILFGRLSNCKSVDYSLQKWHLQSICWQFNKQIITHDWPDIWHHQFNVNVPYTHVRTKKIIKLHENYVAKSLQIQRPNYSKGPESVCVMNCDNFHHVLMHILFCAFEPTKLSMFVSWLICQKLWRELAN